MAGMFTTIRYPVRVTSVRLGVSLVCAFGLWPAALSADPIAVRHAEAGVAHGKLELHLFAGALDRLDLEPHLAALGELHRVVHEVRENLSEPQRISEQAIRNARRGVREEFEPFLVRS